MFSFLLAIIYAAFISLGLPDGLLGAAWPTVYPLWNVPVSYSGIIYFIICLGTIFASLSSDFLTRKLGTGMVTAISVSTTAVALLGFAFSPSFFAMCLWAIPYGLGAGGVDASLNNYVALHYESRHMSWLHCMWGLGASIGPYIMSAVLSGGQSWSNGYLYVGIIQIFLSVGLFCTLPMWKKSAIHATQQSSLSLTRVLTIPGAKAILIAFFCYCALEQTICLWAASYLTLHSGLSPEDAAGWAAMAYLGITFGRFLSGFVTMKLNDTQMIRLGCGILSTGVLLMLLPLGSVATIVGILLAGLGCAPIYPCIIHSTPAHFGAENSQAMVGLQMASAYIGSCLMPPLFGFIADRVSISLLPAYSMVILVVMVLSHEVTQKRTMS